MNFTREWNPLILKKLNEILESENSDSLAVFDFDNTLIYGDQGINLMNYLILNLFIKGQEDWFWDPTHWYGIKQKTIDKIRIKYELALENKDNYLKIDLIDEFYKVYYELEKKDLEIAYRWTKIFFSGFTTEELQQFSKESFKIALQEPFKDVLLPSGIAIQKGIKINSLFLDLIQQLLKKKWNIFIVTASPEIAIQCLSNYWSLPEENILGMKLKIINNKLYPEIIEPYTYNEGKYLNLKQKIDKPIIIAAGDSYPDICLLENSKLPIFVYRKGKEVLLEIAKNKNFFIQNVENG